MSQQKPSNIVRLNKYRPRELSLDDLADASRWVAWREEVEMRKDGSEYKKKIPRAPSTGYQARMPTKPSSYGTREAAERRWRQLDDGSRGGITIVLGDLDEDTLLMSIDLDRCIDPETRNIAPWADEILGRFSSYAEVSPSDHGIKLFFLVAAKDAAAIEGLFGKNPKGEPMLRRAFAAGEHQEIAIDSGRYYAVTGWQLNDVPATLRTVAADDVRWFIKDAEPRYKVLLRKPAGDIITSTTTAHARDESGSGHGYRFMREREAQGDDFETACAAILAV